METVVAFFIQGYFKLQKNGARLTVFLPMKIKFKNKKYKTGLVMNSRLKSLELFCIKNVIHRKNYNTVYPEALYNFFLIYFILNLWVYIIEILLSCAIWYFKSILI